MALLATISLLAFAPFGVAAFTLLEVASTNNPPKVLCAVSTPSTEGYEEIHNKIPKRKIPSTKPRHGKDVTLSNALSQFKSTKTLSSMSLTR